MKKLIACLLTLAMLAGIVPAALAVGAQAASEQPTSIKVLTIGEDFSRASMTNYLHEVLTAEGYTDITLGHLYSRSHYTLADYVNDYKNEKGPNGDPIYVLELNRVNYWDYIYRYDLPMSLTEEDWDYVVLQTSPIQSTKADEFVGALEEMVAIVKELAPGAKIGWHVNWAFQKGYENSSSDYKYLAKFGPYSADHENGTIAKWIEEAKVNEQNDRDQFKAQFDADPDTMFQAIAKAAEQAAKKVDFVVPAGTAVMNAESSFMGDLRADEGEPVVDGANLNETGKLVTSYAWYAAITGKKIDDVKHYEDFLFDLSSAERKAIVEAVNNAVKNPYKITQTSAYKTEPTQYKVNVNGTIQKCLPGDTVTITASALRGGERMFLNWSAVKGNVTFADPKALTTTFKVPAQDVEVQAVYTAAEEAGQLMAGFGRGDATPYDGLLMDGWGPRAVSGGTRLPEDRLNGNAVAISDGETTHILISIDFTVTDTTWLNWLRERVEKETGIPASNVTMSATHTHSATGYGEKEHIYRQGDYLVTSTKEPEYFELWMDAMTQACKDALADLKPVSETLVKSISVPGMNWQRHWRYTTGVMGGANFHIGGSRRAGVTRDADNELQMIRFVRDDAKDVLLINWQGHNHILTSSQNTDEEKETYLRASADMAGALYRYLEKMDEDCHAVIFFGAGGNLDIKFTDDPALQWRWSYLRHAPDTYAAKLGDYILANMDSMDVAQTGKVQNLRQIYKGIYNQGAVPTRDVEQDVITIGDSIAFATASYEMMDTNGMDVKNASPYETTFILTNTGTNHYMGSWQIGHYTLLGGLEAYEAKPASLHFVLGTAEDLADGLSAMLNILYKK